MGWKAQRQIHARGHLKTYHGEKTSCSIGGAGKTATCQRMQLEHSVTPYTKINSKWIKVLNVRPDMIKLLEENIGRTDFDINHTKIFCDPSLTVMKIKTKINKWDLIKLTSFCTAKETVS